MEEDAQFVSPTRPRYRCFPFSSHLRSKSYSRDFSSLIILATWKFLLIRVPAAGSPSRLPTRHKKKKVLKVVVLKQTIPTDTLQIISILESKYIITKKIILSPAAMPSTEIVQLVSRR
jgi:hypothetical protein